MKLRVAACVAVLAAVAALTSACGSDAKPAGPAEVRVASSYTDQTPVSELIDGWQEPKGSGELALPHLAFDETALTTTTTLSYDVADAFGMSEDYDLEDGESLAAPEGREFLIVQLERRRTPWAIAGGTNSIQADTTVRWGDLGHAAPVAIFEGAEAPAQIETLLVTVPPGAEVSIELRDTAAGGTSFMDLRTGERIDDSLTPPAAAAFYPLQEAGSSAATTSASPVTATSSNPGSDGSPERIVLTSTGTITRQPWTPATGWATEGHCWLQFEELTLQAAGYAAPVQMFIDAWSAISVLADGQPVTDQRRKLEVSVEGYVDFQSLGAAYFEVPCDASTYTLVFAPEPKGIGDDEGADLGTWTPGSVDFSFGE